MSTIATNRYARDWNGYSEQWSSHYGSRYAHLGDEWCDDGTAERAHERRVMGLVEPWLRPGVRALEIGPGGGKWTVRLAPRVHTLQVFDVAEAMLERTRQRCRHEGLTNVSFVIRLGSLPILSVTLPTLNVTASLPPTTFTVPDDVGDLACFEVLVNGVVDQRFAFPTSLS